MDEFMTVLYLMPIILPVGWAIYVLISLLLGIYEEVEEETDINDLFNELKNKQNDE